MGLSSDGNGKRTASIYATGALAAAWLGALAIEFLARMLAGIYVHFGADLPGPTIVTLQAVRSYVPWVIVVAATLVVVFLVTTRHRYVLHACAAISIVVGLSLAAGSLALMLPVVKMCGSFLPDWPESAAEPAKAAGASTRSCRPT